MRGSPSVACRPKPLRRSERGRAAGSRAFSRSAARGRAARILTAFLLALGCSRGASNPDAHELADGGPADAGGACGAAVCGAAQRCDETVSPPACVEICNAPSGCRPGWETCDFQSGTCAPLQCGAGPCHLGQGCFDPATFAPRAGEGSACTCLPKVLDPASGALRQQDSCAAYGMVCAYDPATKAAASCRKPREFEGCRSSVGCADGLGCVLTTAGGLCLQSCEEAKDCRKVTEYCEPRDGHCWPNECARPARSASERARYFQPCAAAGAADGTCLPVTSDLGEVGLCFQAGSAPSHGPCDPSADRATPSGLCPVGEVCWATGAGADGAGAAATCRTACDPEPGASPGCSSGERCLDISGPTSPYQGAPGRLGACVPPGSS